MGERALSTPVAKSGAPAAGSQVPFGVNEMRLPAAAWLATIAILGLAVILTPRIWKRLEQFETGADYRIPYQLSKDDWLYQRRADQIEDTGLPIVLGDSVVWGEYVLPDGTLSHFLGVEAGLPGRFVNAGVNGLFPLALEGLVRSYASSIRHRKVLVQCNLLWMSSPKADLQIEKEEKFNHARLVPQFSPRIPCYRADASERLGAVLERQVGFFAWIGHLQTCYFGEKSLLSWTLEEDENDPLIRPHAYKNPFAQITFRVPTAPVDDPLRGPKSPRHKPWTAGGGRPVHFDWVDLEHSLQWGALRRLIQVLRERGNETLVVLGPFNEHLIAPASQPAYRQLRDGIAAWLANQQVPFVMPGVLPSALYADASHPLTDGYQLLAQQLLADRAVRSWLGPNPAAALAPAKQ